VEVPLFSVGFRCICHPYHGDMQAVLSRAHKKAENEGPTAIKMAGQHSLRNGGISCILWLAYKLREQQPFLHLTGYIRFFGS
jgi:hypothetical protein